MDNQSKHILLSYLFEDAASARKLKSLSDKINSVHQEHKSGFDKSAKKKLKDAGFSEVGKGNHSCVYQKIDGDTVHTVKLDKYSPSMNYSNSNGRTSSYYHHIEHEDSHIDKGLAQMVYGGSMYESEEISEISRNTLSRYLAKTRYDYDDGRKSSRELAGKKKWGGTGNLPSAKVPAGDK